MAARLEGLSNQQRAAQFAVELRLALRRSTVQEVVTFQRKAVFVFLNVVLRGTPVDTGRARGGWQVDIGAISARAPRYDRSGTLVISEAGAKMLWGLDPKRPLTVVYVSNAVPYIDVLDRGKTKAGRDWSTRGHGFFERGLAAVRSML